MGSVVDRLGWSDPLRRFVVTAACWALLLTGAAGHAQAYEPVLVTEEGRVIAWWYRHEDLLLAVGEVGYAEVNVAQARRFALLAARATLLRAFARLRDEGGGPLRGRIGTDRLVSTEVGVGRVRVYVAARLTDIELR